MLFILIKHISLRLTTTCEREHIRPLTYLPTHRLVAIGGIHVRFEELRWTRCDLLHTCVDVVNIAARNVVLMK